MEIFKRQINTSLLRRKSSNEKTIETYIMHIEPQHEIDSISRANSNKNIPETQKEIIIHRTDIIFNGKEC